jgi:hypothetical protein
MISTTVVSLKKLCAAILNDGTTWDEIPGETVPDVIDQITLAKGGSIDPGGELGTLTVTSEAGTTSGTTKITVSGNGSGQLYYKTSGNAIVINYHDDLSEWTTWNGTSEIEATDGENICIAEADAQNRAIAAGTATINANVD